MYILRASKALTSGDGDRADKKPVPSRKGMPGYRRLRRTPSATTGPSRRTRSPAPALPNRRGTRTYRGRNGGQQSDSRGDSHMSRMGSFNAKGFGMMLALLAVPPVFRWVSQSGLALPDTSECNAGGRLRYIHPLPCHHPAS